MDNYIWLKNKLSLRPFDLKAVSYANIVGPQFVSLFSSVIT